MYGILKNYVLIFLKKVILQNDILYYLIKSNLKNAFIYGNWIAFTQLIH